MYQTLPCHTRQMSSSPPLTHPAPPPDYWYISFFFVVGPGPLREIAVSDFSLSPLGRADTFSFQHLPPTPRISPSVSSFSRYFLALAFPFLVWFILLIFCTRQNISVNSTYSWLPPESFYIFSTALSHLIPARPFVISPIQPYQL